MFLLSLFGSLSLTILSNVIAQDSPATVTIIATFDYSPTTIYTYGDGISNNGKIVGVFINGKTTGSFIRAANGKIGKPIVYGMGRKRYQTYGLGLNSSGQICGYFVPGGHDTTAHGLFFDGGTFTPYEVPGGSNTVILGENDAGDFVGFYAKPGMPSDFGFANVAGSIVDIDVPGALITSVAGINSADQTCGFYLPSGVTSYRGFYRDADGNFTTSLLYPGALDTLLRSINDSGTMVGTYDDASATHGLIFTLPGTYTSFDVPGSLQTHINGINDSGQICGSYTTADGHSHGFLAQLSN